MKAEAVQGAYQLLGHLTYEGARYRLHTDPLRPLIEVMRHRTDELRWNVEDWGGYQTEWEIEDDQLFLIEVFGFELTTGRRLSLTMLLPDSTDGAVHATWFSGELVWPHGSELRPTEGVGTYSEFLLALLVESGHAMGKRFIRSPSYPALPMD